jgi:putative SOS response-associated peptidase YedK
MERLAFIEHEQEMMLVEIEENDDWIDAFEPPSEVQENIKRVRELELKMAELEIRLSNVESK